jgi:hypothetical protein
MRQLLDTRKLRTHAGAGARGINGHAGALDNEPQTLSWVLLIVVLLRASRQHHGERGTAFCRHPFQWEPTRSQLGQQSLDGGDLLLLAVDDAFG